MTPRDQVPIFPVSWAPTEASGVLCRATRLDTQLWAQEAGYEMSQEPADPRVEENHSHHRESRLEARAGESKSWVIVAPISGSVEQGWGLHVITGAKEKAQRNQQPFQEERTFWKWMWVGRLEENVMGLEWSQKLAWQVCLRCDMELAMH